MPIFGKKRLIDAIGDSYEPQELEIIALVERPMYGGVCVSDKVYEVNVPLLAFIDTASGELVAEPAYLNWAYFQGRSMNRYHVRRLTAYRMRVRLIKQGEKPGGRRFLLTKMLRRNVREPRFDAIIEEYKKPVYLDLPDGGRLTLSREYGWYEGEAEIGGSDVGLRVECPRGSLTATDASIATLGAIYPDLSGWAQRAAEYAATEMAALATDWQEDGREISEEEFLRRITLADVFISDDAFEFFFDDDEMFCCHVIAVSGTIDKGFETATLQC